jgi:hypothetical protein
MAEEAALMVMVEALADVALAMTIATVDAEKHQTTNNNQQYARVKAVSGRGNNRGVVVAVHNAMAMVAKATAVVVLVAVVVTGVVTVMKTTMDTMTSMTTMATEAK